MAIDNETKLIQLRTELFGLLSAYLKAMKDDGSWVYYYITNLKVRPPNFSFNESKEQFEKKLHLLMDIMDLAHLYCKVTNPKDYSYDNHVAHRSNLNFVSNRFGQLSDEQYYELRQYLKTNVMFGTN